MLLKCQRHLVGVEALGAAPEPGALEFFDNLLEAYNLAITMLDKACHVAYELVQ